MSVNIYDKSTDTLNKVAGVAKLDTWTGTQAEFDALDKSTLSDNCYINITDDITGGKLYTWTGTRAEYEAEKDTIPDGCYVNITDDTDAFNFPDGTGFYPDIKDGVRGYNTDPERGADTFHPFKVDCSDIEQGTFNSNNGTVTITLENLPKYKLLSITTDGGYESLYYNGQIIKQGASGYGITAYTTNTFSFKWNSARTWNYTAVYWE